MQLAPIDILGYARWLTLIGCFAYAAWMDKVERRVANEHWIAWSKPLIFIWVLEFLIREADWTIYASAAGVLAYASVSVIGRPTLSDIRSGNPLDIAVASWYILGIAGFVVGSLQYASTGLTPLFDGSADEQMILWFEVMTALVMVLLFEFAWRLRLLHGGADAKAMMWVAMLLPSWYTLSPIWEFSSVHMGRAVFPCPSFHPDAHQYQARGLEKAQGFEDGMALVEDAFECDSAEARVVT